MERGNFVRLAEQLRSPVVEPETYVVPVAHYRDPSWCERERALVARLPRIVAASSELAPGSVRPVADALLARDAEGTLRAFANACRHRGTRLVDAPCAAKALTCPYHGWTYSLAGSLIHVPHVASFGAACERRDLRELPVAERCGLIWLGDDAAGFGCELDADLSVLGLEHHTCYRRAVGARRCNWKLVIEAFLDGYHIRVLHRDSIYRFFIDAASVAERAGFHIRAVTARRALREAPSDLGTTDPRLLGTPSYFVFPATIIIEHPDFVSLITVAPLTPSTCSWEHAMLVPSERAGDTEHWDKSWELIENTVFQREDLWVCEQIQRTLDAGFTDELLFGGLENAAAWFHAGLEDAESG